MELVVVFALFVFMPALLCFLMLPYFRRIKIYINSAHFLSTLLYAAETWTVGAEDASILDSYQKIRQRQILGVRWQHHVRNVDVANQTGLRLAVDHIVKRRDSICGHIAAMSCTDCSSPPGSTLSG